MDQLDIETVKLMQESKDPFMRVLGQLAALKAQRGREYNRGDVKLSDYFPFGRISYAHMVALKALRMKSLCNAEGDIMGLNQSPVFLDTCLDLANYSIFAAMAELERPA